MTVLATKGYQPVHQDLPTLPDGAHLRWSVGRDVGFPQRGFLLFRREHYLEMKPIEAVESATKAAYAPSSRIDFSGGAFESDKPLEFAESIRRWELTDLHSPAPQDEDVPEFDLRNRGAITFSPLEGHFAFRVKLWIGFPGAFDSSARSIEVKAYSHDHVVEHRTITGSADAVSVEEFCHDAITAIEIQGGAAVLAALEFELVNPWRGWNLLSAGDPLTLPVSHPAYDGLVADPNASEDEAVGRVRYGAPDVWRGKPFEDLHKSLLALVQDEASSQNLSGTAGPLGTAAEIERFRHLDWIRLASFNPAMAQMLGLYWIDDAVDLSGHGHYDYMVLACRSGADDSGDLLVRINDVNVHPLDLDTFPAIQEPNRYDAWICTDVNVRPDEPLLPPDRPKSYLLPRPGDLDQVGLRWSRTETAESRVMQAGSPVTHRIWRHALGPADLPVADEPTASEFELLDVPPILVRQWDSESTPPYVPPSGWPPFPLDAVDASVADERWYAYRISAVDLFGRHSPRSPAANWWRWSPAPDPVPWYYEGGDEDQARHPFAVCLLDKQQPPPPIGLEAEALDPADPFLYQDKRYADWFNGLGAYKHRICGLRVRWRWTREQSLQWPDGKEFRIYTKQGRFNTWFGRIANVSPVDDETSELLVTLDTSASQAVLESTVLQQGLHSFSVLRSAPGDPITVVVRNRGDNRDVPPEKGAKCSLALGPDQPSSDSPRDSVCWDERIHVLDRHDFVGVGVGAGAGGPVLEGDEATVEDRTVTIQAQRTVLSDVQPGTDWLHLVDASGEVAFLIKSKNVDDNQVTVAGRPQLLAPSSAWRIGMAYDQYELLLPRPGDGALTSVIPEPSLSQAILRMQVGVTTADGKTHTADHPKWPKENGSSWGGRPGNEGQVAAPREVFRVRRTRPDPPDAPPFVDSENIYATPADYNAQSFYTARWVPASPLKTHILRAMDESVFLADWKNRPRHGPPPDGAFPSDWDDARKERVVTELNKLDDLKTEYGKNEGLAYYRSLSNDALRVLASHQDISKAFSQITIEPLDPDHPDHADRDGPDDHDGYVPQTNLRSYQDTLDGRSTNRYFYRSAHVDEAQNRGPLSRSSPPIYLPNVVPPRAPALAKATLDDASVTLAWASNREADLADYRIYRTEDENSARDVRLMDLIHTRTSDEPVPKNRPALVTWADDSVVGGRIYWYRVQAVDNAGNRSSTRRAMKATAIDRRVPEPPVWTGAHWFLIREADGVEVSWPFDGVVAAGYRPALRLEWESETVEPTFVVARKVRDERLWKSLTTSQDISTPAGTKYKFVDDDVDPSVSYEYLAKVRSGAGVWSIAFRVLNVARP